MNEEKHGYVESCGGKHFTEQMQGPQCEYGCHAQGREGRHSAWGAGKLDSDSDVRGRRGRVFGGRATGSNLPKSVTALWPPRETRGGEKQRRSGDQLRRHLITLLATLLRHN